MATRQHIYEFHVDAYVEITIYPKNADGTVITTPESQKITFQIAETEDGAALLSWNTDDDPSKIALTDAETGKFTLALLPADLSALVAGTTYFYNVRSEIDGSSKPVMHATGRFRLRPSIDYP